MTKQSSKLIVTVAQDEGSITIGISGLNPVPASRPRVTRWGVYYTKTYAAWRKAIHKVLYNNPGRALEGNLAVVLTIRVEKPKTTKRDNPRGDLDNYEKAIYDAISGEKGSPKGYWTDDDQIVSTRVDKRWVGPGEPCGYSIKIMELKRYEWVRTYINEI